MLQSSSPRKLTAFVLSLLAAGLLFKTFAQSPPATGVNTIRADELRQKLTYLASETFNGRGNGTADLNKAADYIAGVLEKNGLKPAGDSGTFFQHFDIYSSRLGSKNDVRIQGMGETDGSLDITIPVKAGSHMVGATFLATKRKYVLPQELWPGR